MSGGAINQQMKRIRRSTMSNQQTEMAVRETAIEHATTGVVQFNPEKVELLKRTICVGATDDELELFVHACKRMGLDPFMRQIHAVKRWNGQMKREVMTIQTGIDGYRLIAERTGKYMPGPKPAYEYDEKGNVVCATAFVKRMGPDGHWHVIEADAFFDEYATYTREGKPTQMWAEKPHIMLSKCAEALALRRAFPAELSGVYTAEEMDRANETPTQPTAQTRNSQPSQQSTDPSTEAGYLAEWTKAIVSRNGTPEEAAELHRRHLAAKKTTFEKMHPRHREAAIEEAWLGEYDDELHKLWDEQQSAGAAPAAEQKPAEPPITAELVGTWDAFETAALDSAVRRNVETKVAVPGLEAFLNNRNPGTVSTAERMNVVMAIRAGTFDFTTGKIVTKVTAKPATNRDRAA